MSEDLEQKDSATTEHDSGADTSHHDHSDSGRSESLRENIRAAWKEQTGEEPEDSRRDRDEDRNTKRKPWEPKSRAAREAKQATDAQQRDKQTGTTDTAAQPRSAAFGPDGAPTAWAKEAKNLWSQLPKEIQAAVTKREQDVERGVGELRQRYADIDRAFAPHMRIIQAHGHTPAQSVERFFQWFDALSRNPQAAFPALAKSFGHDMSIYGGSQQQQAQQYQQAQQGQQTYDPALLNYLNTVEQRFGAMEHQRQEQLQAQTQDILDRWAQGKEFFQEVRFLMGQLLQPDAQGRAVIPLKDGSVDLDGAYAAACAMTPHIAAKMQQQQAAAERQRAKEVSDRARRSSASLIPSAPGGNNFGKGKPKGGGKSVRESISDAIRETSGNRRF